MVAISNSPRYIIPLLVGALLSLSSAHAQGKADADYAIGSPTLADIWVDRAHGDDASSGATRAQAVRTLSQAWSRIPANTTLTTTGYRLQLVAGSYPFEDTPQWYEHYLGTASFPIIVNAADGPGTAVLQNLLNLSDCRHVYFLGVNIVPGDPQGADAFHLEGCSHILLRHVTINGNGATRREAQEAFKANQTQNLYLEDCDIGGGFDNGLDCVAVQYGHIRRCRLHDANSWCAYLKGGSAYFRLDGNELYNGDEGGFSAGQGTGFEYMVSPWIHYEAYDIKFTNNVIHDVSGAAFGTNGGYNILLAYNTAYRVGARSHVIEVAHGTRGCEGNTTKCSEYLAAGGWGTKLMGEDHRQPIPARNVHILNNIVYNPPGYQSQWQHFCVEGPRTAEENTNIPSPSLVDVNLRIAGNLIWNGPADHPLGIEEAGNGCADTNPTCNAAQLRADNTINTVQPQLADPAHGNFHPVEGGNVFTASPSRVNAFAGGDRPSSPNVPEGDLSNAVGTDRDGKVRTAVGPPGAHVTGGASTQVSTLPANSPAKFSN